MEAFEAFKDCAEIKLIGYDPMAAFDAGRENGWRACCKWMLEKTKGPQPLAKIIEEELND